MHRRHPARVRRAATPSRIASSVLVVGGRGHVALAEPPGRLLAQDACRLAGARRARRRLRATSRSPSARASAAELSQSEWSSFEIRLDRRVAGDRVERVPRGSRLGYQSALRQPSPAASGPGRQPHRATRPTASSSERAPSRRTWRCASDHVGKCTCASLKPGQTQRPPRSTRSRASPDRLRPDPVAGDRQPLDRRGRRIEGADRAAFEEDGSHRSLFDHQAAQGGRAGGRLQAGRPPRGGAEVYERFNVAPTQELPAVVQDRGGRRVRAAALGAGPRWAQDLIRGSR